jgi:hypothetical protein
MSEETTNPTLPLGGSQDPFEAAATMFGLYAPKFELQLKTLSTGQLRRLANALVQYPLNEKEFINEDKNLREAFSVGQSLLEAKWLMTMHTLMQHEQKMFQEESQTTPEASEESASDNEKVVSNG